MADDSSGFMTLLTMETVLLSSDKPSLPFGSAAASLAPSHALQCSDQAQQ